MTEPADPNPYVGPRAFRAGEPLFGRDREKRELLALWLAERIVLLHSPSGAGKTLLIQALLLDALDDEEIKALPVIRVSAEAPPRDCPEVRGANRYVLGALLSMDGARPEKWQIPLPELAGMSLDAYLTRRAGEEPYKGKPIALVFDQFEEILHLDATDIGAKEEFFDQVGIALRNRDRWALFAMREDYIGALEPYQRRLPTRLRTAYRLDLLGEAAARLAIVEPARGRGVDFVAEKAKALVDDLRTVSVQRPDGKRDQQLGPHIEPVQLQVVCYRIWSRLPPGAKEIRPEKSAEAAGDVDAALAGYYADSVAAISRKTGVRERAIREWVEAQLITEQGTRGQVLFAPEKSQGLENTAIKGLVAAHLLREEYRRGFTWFELAHDRLIAPVLADNAVWMKKNLHALQRQAGLWDRQGHLERLLLGGVGLRDAEAWAGAHAAEILPVESDFLAACREAVQKEDKELESRRTVAELAHQQRENRRFRAWLALTSILAVAALGMLYVSCTSTMAARKAQNDLEQQDKTLKQALARLNLLVSKIYDHQALAPQEQTEATRERQRIASGRTVKERKEILVQYCTKKRNRRVVRNLWEQGFRVRNLDSTYDATNAIWYGPGVQAEDLRVVALTLTEAGVKVQRILSVPDPAGYQNVISIGTVPESVTLPVLTVEQINKLELRPYPALTGSPVPPTPPPPPAPAKAN